jgi:uncharacterized protein (DUF362 family)
MLDKGITEFFSTERAQDGWKKAFSPDDKVAIKVNVLSAWYAANSSPFKAVTHPELAYAVADGIVSAGVKPGNVTIYERKDSDANPSGARQGMLKSGYELSAEPDKIKVIEGGEYGPEETLSNGLKVNYLKLLYDRTKIVNMPVLKAHHIMGFTFSLKNHLGSYKDAVTKTESGAIAPGSAASMHGDAGVVGVAALNSHPVLKNKSSLIVGDLLRVQYRMMFSDPEGSWAYNGILIGNDPVAVDAVAWHILKEKRQAMNVDYWITVPMDAWYMTPETERAKYKIYADKMRYGGVAGAYLEDCAKAGLGKINLSDIDLEIIDLKD